MKIKFVSSGGSGKTVQCVPEKKNEMKLSLLIHKTGIFQVLQIVTFVDGFLKF